MRSHLKRLASESAVYGLAPIAQRLIAVFLTPIYTRIFLPADYGAMSLIDGVFQLLAVVVVLALDSAAFRWFYDSTDDEDRKKTIASWLWTHFSLATLVVVGASLFPARTLVDLTGRTDAGRLFLLAAAALPFFAFEIVLTNYFRIRRKPWHTMAYSLAGMVLNIGLTLLLVVWLRVGLTGIYISGLLTRLSMAAIAVAILRGWANPARFRVSRLREMLRYSLPMVPAGLFAWVVVAADRSALAHYQSPIEVGLYSIGVSVGAVLSLFTVAFQSAWSAFAFSISAKPEAPSVYAATMELYLLGTCLIALGLSLFAPEALRILATPPFYAAENVVALIAVGYVMVGLLQITGLGAMLAKNTHPLLHAFALSAIINIVLVFALVPKFGRVGAAVATLTSQAVLPIYLLHRSQRLWRIPYRSWLIGVVPTTTLVLAFAGRAITHNFGFYSALILKLLVVGIFLLQALALEPVRRLLFKHTLGVTVDQA